jgi:hypothetical protein
VATGPTIDQAKLRRHIGEARFGGTCHIDTNTPSTTLTSSGSGIHDGV